LALGTAPATGEEAQLTPSYTFQVLVLFHRPVLTAP
jgi:hypothetical protein